jgi:hypothetical protein
MEALYHRVYLWGYSGHQPPRWLRRALAGSQWHRAWFLGFSGFFEQDGTSFGLARPYTPSGGNAFLREGA